MMEDYVHYLTSDRTIKVLISLMKMLRNVFIFIYIFTILPEKLIFDFMFGWGWSCKNKTEVKQIIGHFIFCLSWGKIDVNKMDLATSGYVFV